MSENTKNLRGRPKALNQQAVLNVAVTAYWQEGPDGISLNSVCRLADVSKPSLYREFGSEDGLTCAVLEYYAQHVLGQLVPLLQSERTFTEKLQALCHFAVNDPQNAHGCLFVKMRAARVRMGPKTQAKIDEIDAAVLQAYTVFIQQAQDRGSCNRQLPAELGAQYLHAQIGLALARRDLGDTTESIGAVLDLALSIFGNLRGTA